MKLLMVDKCIKCNIEINPLRLKALPETKTCVNCSSTERWYVRNIISGKTFLISSGSGIPNLFNINKLFADHL